MPRLIDEDGLKHSIWEYTDKYGHIEMTINFFNILLERNRVDAEPVVRCKDCKWCHAGYCEKADDIIPFGFPLHEWENFYCAWGERREEVNIQMETIKVNSIKTKYVDAQGNELVSVVRCKDCQYRGSTAECLERDDGWFCVDGKRREDAKIN